MSKPCKMALMKYTESNKKRTEISIQIEGSSKDGVKKLIIVGNYICASRSFQIILSDLCVCEPELLCKCYCVSVKLCKS